MITPSKSVRPFEYNRAPQPWQKHASGELFLGGWKVFLKNIARRKGVMFTLLQPVVKVVFRGDGANENAITIVEVGKDYDMSKFIDGAAIDIKKPDRDWS